jgi:hypothetical protein
MDILSLLALIAMVSLGWFWLNSLRILELARKAGKQACINADVQFLDDTVAGNELAFARNDRGRRVLRRTYCFEFSETGNSRLEGQVIMLGDKIESVTMDPYQIVE